MWLDSHCHVTADRFDADREDVLERARQAGVETLIAIGSGGNYALAAARALNDMDDLDAETVARKAMAIAADICVYTNNAVVLEKIPE